MRQFDHESSVDQVSRLSLILPPLPPHFFLFTKDKMNISPFSYLDSPPDKMNFKGHFVDKQNYPSLLPQNRDFFFLTHSVSKSLKKSRFTTLRAKRATFMFCLSIYDFWPFSWSLKLIFFFFTVGLNYANKRRYANTQTIVRSKFDTNSTSLRIQKDCRKVNLWTLDLWHKYLQN